MIVLHAIWTNGALHLWGEQCSDGNASPALTANGEAHGSQESPFAVSEEVLRSYVGDVYDSLLVSSAGGSELTLRVPHRNGRTEEYRRIGTRSYRSRRCAAPPAGW